MEDESANDLRTELAELEAREAQLSAMRGRLHDQIDRGFASEATRAHEREISDERRQLHRQIDSLRGLLGVQVEPRREALGFAERREL